MKLKILTIVFLLMILPIVASYDFAEIENYDSYDNTLLRINYLNETLETLIFNEERYCFKFNMTSCNKEYLEYKNNKVDTSINDYLAMTETLVSEEDKFKEDVLVNELLDSESMEEKSLFEIIIDMIKKIFVRVDGLENENELLKSELCKRDDTYKFCETVGEL